MNPSVMLHDALVNLIPLAAKTSPRAYLDPGSGSILLQLLVAGILGGLFAARAFWGRIKARLTRRPKEGQEDEVGD